MDDDFDPQLADRFRVLDRVAVPDTWSPADGTVAVRTARRRRGAVLAAAAAVVAIALVGVAVFTRDRGATVAGPSSSASTTAAPNTTSSSTVTTDPAAPPPEIDWQMVRPEGSISRSNVDAVVAGPNGFVATGMGLDDGKNWGGLWHSIDGVTWTEVIGPNFGASSLGAPVATTSAYYVISWPVQRSGTFAHSPMLFSSVDGTDWLPLAPADGLQLLGAVGDLLVAVTTGAGQGLDGDTAGPSTTAPVPPTEVLVSVDGVTWTPALFKDGVPEFTTFGWIVSAGGRSYLNGVSSDLIVWESTDGMEWHQVPAPPEQGVLTTLGSSPAIVGNPQLEPCLRGLDSPTATGVPTDGETIDAYIEAQWQCGGLATIWQWDGDDWAMLTAAGPGPSPVLGTVLPFAGQLVAPVITPDRMLTAATSVDGVDWTPARSRAFLPGEGGSSQMAIAAVSADVAVFITPGGMGQFTNLLIGTAVPEPPVQPMTGLLAIGESVMIGAIAELEAAGFVLDAKEGRGPEGAKNAIQRHLDDGTLPDTVVIQIGTNAPLQQEELDAILELLAGRTVLMMTVHADIQYIDANNALIRALPERYPNVKVADWDALVDGGTVTLTPDGIHLGQYGPAPYVQLILDTLAAD
ncbi:MAG: hypothetical protein ABMA25_07075 [Ilumatobacteraceae bacterium]